MTKLFKNIYTLTILSSIYCLDIEPIDINEYWNAPMPEVMVDIINDLMRMGDGVDR